MSALRWSGTDSACTVQPCEQPDPGAQAAEVAALFGVEVPGLERQEQAGADVADPVPVLADLHQGLFFPARLSGWLARLSDRAHRRRVCRLQAHALLRDTPEPGIATAGGDLPHPARNRPLTMPTPASDKSASNQPASKRPASKKRYLLYGS